MVIEQQFSIILAIYLAGLIFGIGYNLLIGWAEKKRYLEGYTWLAVVVGVLATLGLTAVMDWAFALFALGSFCFTGAPMAMGAIWRHVKAREREQRAGIPVHFPDQPDPIDYPWKKEPGE